ncbi:MAG: 5' nucleotidase, NT5C type [Candidatus Saccharimonadales bacterium]
MARETIAVDADDVLAAHIEEFVAHSNKYYGTNLTPEDYTERWGVLWGVDDEEVGRRASEFHKPEIVGNFGVIEEAELVLRALKRSRELVVVTARAKHITDTTSEWIERHFPGVFSETHFVPIWEPGNTLTKADICRHIGASYLIDDLVRHCIVAAEAGIQPVLFRRIGWDQGESPHPKVVQVNNWQEVLEYFDGRG